jgi:hypothetical protein
MKSGTIPILICTLALVDCGESTGQISSDMVDISNSLQTVSTMLFRTSGSGVNCTSGGDCTLTGFSCPMGGTASGTFTSGTNFSFTGTFSGPCTLQDGSTSPTASISGGPFTFSIENGSGGTTTVYAGGPVTIDLSGPVISYNPVTLGSPVSYTISVPSGQTFSVTLAVFGQGAAVTGAQVTMNGTIEINGSSYTYSDETMDAGSSP